MKKYLSLLVLVLVVVLVPSCASPNPNAGKPDPITGQPQPPFSPNKTGTDIVNGAAPVAAALPPPYSAIAIGVLTLTTAIMGYAAQQKNAAATTATATANQLAASVAAQPATVTQAILDHASTNVAVYPAVAGLVNQNTPG